MLVDLATYAGYDSGLTLLSKIVQAESFDETRRVPTGNDFGEGRPGLHPGVVHAAGEPVQGLPGQRG